MKILEKLHCIRLFFQVILLLGNAGILLETVTLR